MHVNACASFPIVYVISRRVHGNMQHQTRNVNKGPSVCGACRHRRLTLGVCLSEEHRDQQVGLISVSSLPRVPLSRSGLALLQECRTVGDQAGLDWRRWQHPPRSQALFDMIVLLIRDRWPLKSRCRGRYYMPSNSTATAIYSVGLWAE